MRGNEAWIRSAPVVNGYQQCSSATGWWSYLDSADLPGSGTMQAHTTWVIDDTLYEDVWRNNQSWSRTIPLTDGMPNWHAASSWSGPTSTAGLPGSGDIQAEARYVIGDKLYQDLWRNGQGYQRSFQIINGNLQNR